MKRVRLGLVGCGVMGPLHATAAVAPRVTRQRCLRNKTLQESYSTNRQQYAQFFLPGFNHLHNTKLEPLLDTFS